MTFTIMRTTICRDEMPSAAHGKESIMRLITRCLIVSLALMAAHKDIQAEEDLIQNGGFEMIGDDGMPECWKINSAYPGDDVRLVKDAKQAHAGQRYLRVVRPSTARGGTAILFKKSISKTCADFTFRCYCRGAGKLTFAFAGWDARRFLASVAGPSFDVNDDKTWNPCEGTIQVPPKLSPPRKPTDNADESAEPAEEVEVVNLIAMLVVDGNVDIDDVSLSAKPDK